jgi:hypothetical protein
MSDFLCYFADEHENPAPDSLAEFGGFLNCYVAELPVQRIDVEGASLVIHGDGTSGIRWARCGESFAVVRGVLFRVDRTDPTVELEELLRTLEESGELGDWNAFEGTFALCMWDAKRKRAWFANDQASTLSMYYGEFQHGLWVGTQAVGLSKAAGTGLSPHGLRQFLGRGVTTCPRSLFDGVHRVDIGEHGSYARGQLQVERHWRPYAEAKALGSYREAAASAASLTSDRMRRIAAVGGTLICDLSGGYDTRLMVSSAHFARVPFEVTVNGPPDLDDVVLSHRLAEATGWRMNYFDTTTLWSVPIDRPLLDKLSVASNGDFAFSGLYHQYLTRPDLGNRFDLHMHGIGGEFLRYHPWGQEFFGIGRRRRANVDNVLKYRALHGGAPPEWLYDQDWYPSFVDEFRKKLESIADDGDGTLTTQQLDAIHIWKMTGHASLWVTGTFNWLPGCSPNLMAGFLGLGISMPWRMRLTSQLQRRTIDLLCPEAAAVQTTYGGTARPPGLRNAYWDARLLTLRGIYLARKVWEVTTSATGFARPRPGGFGSPPWNNADTRELIDPSAMRSAGLYRRAGLERVAGWDETEWAANERVITRIATIESLCQILGIEPDADTLVRA